MKEINMCYAAYQQKLENARQSLERDQAGIAVNPRNSSLFDQEK